MYECGLRGRERLSVGADNAYFLPVQARKLQSFPEQHVFVILVVRRERVLMDDYHVGAVTTGAGEVRQQGLNLRN